MTNRERRLKKLTVAEVRRRAEKVEQAAENGNDDQAHGLADALHEDVLAAIAVGARTPKLLAKEAIRTVDMKFARWYA